MAALSGPMFVMIDGHIHEHSNRINIECLHVFARARTLWGGVGSVGVHPLRGLTVSGTGEAGLHMLRAAPRMVAGCRHRSGVGQAKRGQAKRLR